jgi:hypothetical protein
LAYGALPLQLQGREGREEDETEFRGGIMSQNGDGQELDVEVRSDGNVIQDDTATRPAIRSKRSEVRLQIA